MPGNFEWEVLSIGTIDGHSVIDVRIQYDDYNDVHQDKTFKWHTDLKSKTKTEWKNSQEIEQLLIFPMRKQLKEEYEKYLDDQNETVKDNVKLIAYKV